MNSIEITVARNGFLVQSTLEKQDADGDTQWDQFLSADVDDLCIYVKQFLMIAQRDATEKATKLSDWIRDTQVVPK